jgi:uncharacterized protein YndB with AHSA1/START domain
MSATNPKPNPPQFGPEHRHQFAISRMFDAPRELVFSLWSDPNHLRRWWGPKGCTVGLCNMDLRPGGQLLYNLQMPDGNEMWGSSSIAKSSRPNASSSSIPSPTRKATPPAPLSMTNGPSKSSTRSTSPSSSTSHV